MMTRMRHPNIVQVSCLHLSSASTRDVTAGPRMADRRRLPPAMPPASLTCRSVCLPRTAQFMGLCTLPPALITEYCQRGSLYDVLQTAKRDASVAAQLTWRRRLGMAVDAGTGLLYLHSRSILHRDGAAPEGGGASLPGCRCPAGWLAALLSSAAHATCSLLTDPPLPCVLFLVRLQSSRQTCLWTCTGSSR